MDKKEELMKKILTLLQEIDEAVKMKDDREAVYLTKYKENVENVMTRSVLQSEM